MESFVEFARVPRRVLKRALSRVQADIIFSVRAGSAKRKKHKWDSRVAHFSFHSPLLFRLVLLHNEAGMKELR